MLKFSGGNDLPIVLQAEAAECGLACLSMTLGYHGYKTDLTTLRRKFPVSLKGATLNSLMKIADQLGLSTRAIRINMAALSAVELPAILHWDMTHFVVLKNVGRKKIAVHDPAHGVQEYTFAEAAKRFSGVALELRPGQAFKKIEDLTPVKLTDFWGRISGLKRNIAQAFILSTVIQVFALAAPMYQQMVVDDAITKMDVDFLSVLALGFIIMGIINISVSTLRSYVMLRFSTILNFQMALNLMRHLIRLPVDFFERRHIGDITSRFGSLGPIKQLFTTGIIGATLDGIMAIGTLVMVILYSGTLAAVVCSFLLLELIIQWFTFPIIRKKSEEIIQLGATENSTFLETIRAARTIKIFGQEAERENIWQNLKADTMNAEISLASFNIKLGVLASIISRTRTILLMYLSASLVMEGTFTLGMMFAFQAYSGQFSSRVTALIGHALSFRMLGLHLQRLADMVHTEPEFTAIGEETRSGNLGRGMRGSIELCNISYRYGANEPYVLKDISLKIKAGEMLAISGPSGGGKTTMMKILLGLLEPTEGEVLVDGLPIRQFGVQRFRSNLGVVMQDDQLISGTIGDNISFNDPKADMGRIMDCARAAQLHTDITAMPMGYYSLIGDMGSSLSGGQQQRLLIARALYRGPRILLLDEGTANLDLETEKRIAALISNLPITRIIIAHRPELIKRADRHLSLVGAGLLEVDHSRMLK